MGPLSSSLLCLFRLFCLFFIHSALTKSKNIIMTRMNCTQRVVEIPIAPVPLKTGTVKFEANGKVTVNGMGFGEKVVKATYFVDAGLSLEGYKQDDYDVAFSKDGTRAMITFK